MPLYVLSENKFMSTWVTALWPLKWFFSALGSHLIVINNQHWTMWSSDFCKTKTSCLTSFGRLLFEVSGLTTWKLHCVHLYGFSPVWMRRWAFRFPAFNELKVSMDNRAQWECQNENFETGHLFSIVKLNFNVGLFSCIFWFEAIFLCKSAIFCRSLFTREKGPK